MNFLYAGMMVLSLTCSLFAQDGAKAPSGFDLQSFLPMMLVMFAVLWFFMIRPEQKKQKEKQNMMSSMKKGDKILTIGGIHATIGSVKDDIVMARIGDNTTVKLAKSAVSSVFNQSKDDDNDAKQKKK